MEEDTVHKVQEPSTDSNKSQRLLICKNNQCVPNQTGLTVRPAAGPDQTFNMDEEIKTLQALSLKF